MMDESEIYASIGDVTALIKLHRMGIDISNKCPIIACEYGHLSVLDYYQKNINDEYDYTLCMFAAIRNGHYGLLEYINYMTDEIIYYAIEHGNDNVLVFFEKEFDCYDAGININNLLNYERYHTVNDERLKRTPYITKRAARNDDIHTLRRLIHDGYPIHPDCYLLFPEL